MSASNFDLKLHIEEQAKGLRPPPVSRVGLPMSKRSRTNRKAQMKAMHGHRLEEYQSYLINRLAMVRELIDDRDN